MEIGERVRVIKVPDGLQDGPELKTKMLFERCLGEIFPVMGFDGDLLALDVGEINGLAPYLPILKRSILSPLVWRLLPKSEGFKCPRIFLMDT